jgi:hypothetical protein
MNSPSGSKLTSDIREALSRGTPPKTKPTSNKRDIWVGAAVLLGIITLFSVMVQPSQDEKDADRHAGFHCLSSWDGSHRELVDLVRESLRDPSSFEHVETRVTPVDAKGEHRLVMKYRAKNGFGGTNLEMAYASYRNSDCKIVSWVPGE